MKIHFHTQDLCFAQTCDALKSSAGMGIIMHILMYRWKAYNYRDIEQTFLLLGHTVDNIEQHLGNYDIDPEFEKSLKTNCGKRTMIWYLRSIICTDFECLPEMGIKYVSWSCDNPLISMYHESIFIRVIIYLPLIRQTIWNSGRWEWNISGICHLLWIRTGWIR